MDPIKAASEQGAALIRVFEGFSATVYRCPAGLPTIGYGHVVLAGEVFDSPITPAQAEALLLRDLGKTSRAVGRLLPVPLEAHQRAALLSFTYNLGAGALQRSTLRRKILRGEHEDVPDELMRWVWAGGRKLGGLVQRRQAEGRCYQGAD